MQNANLDLQYLQTLYENDALEPLVNLTKKSKHPAVMFFYLKALLKLGEFGLALSYIEEHSILLYEYDALSLMQMHIDILLEEARFDYAINMLKMYEDYPYFSQEANDLIKELQAKVNAKRSNSTKKRELTIKDLKTRLNHENIDLFVSALVYIINEKEPLYFDLLRPLLLEEYNTGRKSLVIIHLLRSEIDSDFEIWRYGTVYTVNFNKVSKTFYEYNARFATLFPKEVYIANDVTLERAIWSVFFRHRVHTFPLEIALEDEPFLIKYYHYIALNMIGNPHTLEQYAAEYSLALDELPKYRNKYHLHVLRF